MSQAKTPRFLTRLEVLDMVGVTFPTLWAWMRRGEFPLSRTIGRHRVAWIASEVEEWMLSRPVKKYKPIKRRAA